MHILVLTYHIWFIFSKSSFDLNQTLDHLSKMVDPIQFKHINLNNIIILSCLVRVHLIMSSLGLTKIETSVLPPEAKLRSLF